MNHCDAFFRRKLRKSRQDSEEHAYLRQRALISQGLKSWWKLDAYYLCLGIHPSEQPPNYYRLAGLPLFETQPNAIQVACDRQLAHLATLQNGPYAEFAQRLFNELAIARMCLLRPDLKAAYDAHLMQLIVAGQAPRDADPTGLQLHAASQTEPAAIDSPNDEDESWDATEEIRPIRRTRRARRKSDGSRAALGLVAIVIASAGAALLWSAFSPPLARPQIKRPSMQLQQDGQRLTKKEPSRLISQERRPTLRSGSASGSDDSDFQSSTPAMPRTNDHTGATAPFDGRDRTAPAGASQVAPAFAGRLDPRMNPDLASILGSDGAMTDQQTAELRNWEDDASFSPELGGFDPINLGGGIILSMAMVDISPDSVAMMLPAEGDVFNRKNSDGAVTGVFSSVRGVLEGPAMELSTASRLSLFGAYEHGKRDGDFRIYGKQQKRLLYSRYSRGIKQGLTCVFRNGLPRYIEVSAGRGIKDEFLIRFEGRKPQVIARRDFSPEDELERPVARARLAALESSLASRERIYGKQLEAWWVGIEKQRATASARGGKINPSLRGQMRQTGDSATFSTLLRGALAP